MERAVALLATLAAGGLVALQPPANALLARHVGDLGAAFTSLLLSTAIVGVLLLLAGEPGSLRQLDEFEWRHALGGIAGAAIVVVSLITVRTLGASGVVAALVAMQLVVSALLDKAGVLGLREAPLDTSRVLGIGLLVLGTIMVTSR